MSKSSSKTPKLAKPKISADDIEAVRAHLQKACQETSQGGRMLQEGEAEAIFKEAIDTLYSPNTGSLS